MLPAPGEGQIASVHGSDDAADAQLAPVRRRFSFDVAAQQRDSLRLLKHLTDVLTSGGAQCIADEAAFSVTAVLQCGGSDQDVSIRCSLRHQGSGLFVVTATVASSCSDDSCRAFIAYMKSVKAAFATAWQR